MRHLTFRVVDGKIPISGRDSYVSLGLVKRVTPEVDVTSVITLFLALKRLYNQSSLFLRNISPANSALSWSSVQRKQVYSTTAL